MANSKINPHTNCNLAVAKHAIGVGVKAQVSLEFSAAFIALLILLVATTKLFVWFGNNIVNRHMAYEGNRTAAGFNGTEAAKPFYNQSEHPLEIFK